MSSEDQTSEIKMCEKRKDIEDNDNEMHINKKLNIELQTDEETEKNDLKNQESNNDLEPLRQPAAEFFGKNPTEISKSMLKKYKKMLSWEASKKDKRKKEKERAKQRKIEARLNNVDLGPSRKQLKMCKMSTSPCKTGVIIDLSFDDLMIPKVIF